MSGNKMKVYVIINEWCVDYEGGVHVVGVFTDKEKAKREFKNYVDSTARIDTINNNYPIKTDTDTYFESYLDGAYTCNHITVFIEEEELEQ